MIDRENLDKIIVVYSNFELAVNALKGAIDAFKAVIPFDMEKDANGFKTLVDSIETGVTDFIYESTDADKYGFGVLEDGHTNLMKQEAERTGGIFEDE